MKTLVTLSIPGLIFNPVEVVDTFSGRDITGAAAHYDSVGKIATRAGAGTSFWSSPLDRYYVAAPANGTQDAAILVYAP